MARSAKAVIVGRQLVNADSSYRDLSITPVVLLYLNKVEKTRLVHSATVNLSRLLNRYYVF